MFFPHASAHANPISCSNFQYDTVSKSFFYQGTFWKILHGSVLHL